jgi:hypothetical protein
MTAVLPENTKGRVGLAVNRNQNVFFNGVSMEPYDGEVYPSDNSIRSFEKCLQETNSLKRTNSCKAKFKGFPAA